MSYSRVAVIVVTDVNTGKPLPSAAMSECNILMDWGVHSVSRFWEENLHYSMFFQFDYFGPYKVEFEGPPSTPEFITRQAIKQIPLGTNLNVYEYFVVLFSAHRDFVAQAGYLPNGIPCCTVPVTETRTTLCQYFGYMLSDRFRLSSWGIPTDNSAAFGDPYDIMSAPKFGGASSTFKLSSAYTHELFTHFPNMHERIGPMISRAHLHFVLPMAMESKNKVVHVQEAPHPPEWTTLYPAGNSNRIGYPELICFHPVYEDPLGHGRVYVEYRQNSGGDSAHRGWDIGLGSSDLNDLDRPGLIIHMVKKENSVGSQVVWYTGRIVFPAIDTDININLDGVLGRRTLTIRVHPSDGASPQPKSVRVGFVRGSEPTAWINVETKKQVEVIKTEYRQAFNNKTYTWVTSKITSTSRYTAMTYGFGGTGAFDLANPINVSWKVQNLVIPPGHYTPLSMYLPAPYNKLVTIKCHLDEHNVLTLQNDPSDGAYEVPVELQVSDASPGANSGILTATSKFVALGIKEGWGADYYAFSKITDVYTGLNVVFKVNNNNNNNNLDASAIHARIQNAWTSVEEIEATNPELAKEVWPQVAEFERSQLQLLSSSTSTSNNTILPPSLIRPTRRALL